MAFVCLVVLKPSCGKNARSIVLHRVYWVAWNLLASSGNKFIRKVNYFKRLLNNKIRFIRARMSCEYLQGSCWCDSSFSPICWLHVSLLFCQQSLMTPHCSATPPCSIQYLSVMNSIYVFIYFFHLFPAFIYVYLFVWLSIILMACQIQLFFHRLRCRSFYSCWPRLVFFSYLNFVWWVINLTGLYMSTYIYFFC